MKEFLLELYDIFKKFIYFITHFKTSIVSLEEDSLVAIRYFINFGELFKAKIRLKTMVALWPKNSEAKYLLGFVYVMFEDNKMAVYYFNKLQDDKKYSNISKKFMSFIDNNKSMLLVDEYWKNLSIVAVEEYVEKNSSI